MESTLDTAMDAAGGQRCAAARRRTVVDLVSKTSIITENFIIKVRGMNELFETVRFQWARSDQDTIDNSCRKSNLKFAHFSKRFFLKIFIK